MVRSLPRPARSVSRIRSRPIGAATSISRLKRSPRIAPSRRTMRSTTSIVATACANPPHEDTHIPHAEVEQRKLDAVVYREYLDPAFTIPNTAPIVPADINEPRYDRRVPGAVLYAEPGERLFIHVLNADDFPHSFHIHGLVYGIDSDGSWPFGVADADGRRSDAICPGDEWCYTFDVTEETIGAWPFHDHYADIYRPREPRSIWRLDRARSTLPGARPRGAVLPSSSVGVGARTWRRTRGNRFRQRHAHAGRNLRAHLSRRGDVRVLLSLPPDAGHRARHHWRTRRRQRLDQGRPRTVRRRRRDRSGQEASSHGRIRVPNRIP